MEVTLDEIRMWWNEAAKRGGKQAMRIQQLIIMISEKRQPS